MLSQNSRTVVLVTLLIVSLPGILQAQEPADPAQMALDYAAALQGNAKALQAYSWNERTQVSMGGENVVVILQLVRYTTDGDLQATLISQEPEKPGGRGPKKKKAKKIYDGSVEAANAIPKLLVSYTMLSSGQLVDFFGKGTLSPGDGDMAGTTKIVGANVLQQGDAVTLWLDMATMLPKGMDVKTVANEKVIEASLDFSVLEEGTAYPSAAEAVIAENDMTIKYETFDHKK